MIRLLAWAVVAVAARLAVSWASADAGVFADMTQYHERAVHLATTGTLFPDALRSPGYPVLLALAYRIGGESLWSARVANALVGGLSTLLTGWLAMRCGAGARAWIAAAVVAIYPALVLSSVYLMPDALYATLAVLTLLVVRHRAVWMAGVAGALAGLAILTRSVGLVLPGVSAVLAVWSVVARAAASRSAALRVAAFALAAGVVLAPWLVFTTRVAGGPLLDATSGMNVLLGNHPAATGRLVMSDDEPLRQRHVVGAVSVADAVARATRAGLSWAVAHPGAWLRLAGAKVGYLLGLEGREHAWVYGHGYFGARRPLVVWAWGLALMVSFPLLVVAAAVGISRAAGPLEASHVALVAFVLLTCGLHVASFGESRFHLPLVPVLAVAAALGPGAAARSGAGLAAPSAGAVRDATGRTRAIVALAVVVVLAVVWLGQAPELWTALQRLQAQDGWQSALPY